MLTNQEAKFIKSLQIKKYRNKHRAFLVEGAKNIMELVQSDFKIKNMLLTNEFFEKGKAQFLNAEFTIYLLSQRKIESLGTYKSNNAGLAVVEIPEQGEPVMDDGIVLALDDINDPGNLGTILRTADWYGIKTVIASPNTAEVYNPKVIQASMGSFTRVNVFYKDLEEFLVENKSIYAVGADLNGKSVHHTKTVQPMIVVMGSESKGLSTNLISLLDEKITIPKYGFTESLNVAMSTAIICDNLCRQMK